jgi:hypothetical protein
MNPRLFASVYDAGKRGKFPALACSRCYKSFELGDKLLVKVDISGWLLHAFHSETCGVYDF